MPNLDARLSDLKKMPPNGASRRILAEADYARRVSLVDGGQYDALISDALDILEEGLKADGAITNGAAKRAEEALMPMSARCKQYALLFVGHAHIDMNWMWRYDETVSITLDTFRTMLDLMDEYPEFTFAQSQASVYRIVEQHDAPMLERIRRRVAEGRWEVSASTWVEADRNMPSGESVARSHLYTRAYLSALLGIDGDTLNIDFEPDTFGHAETTPELLSQAGVKYYYHCRGDEGELLYRWRGRSGAQVLNYREPFWYLGAVGEDYAHNVPEFCSRYGVSAAIRVYGVGDHGGGPTRRDINNIIDMMSWPVFPAVRFGTYREFYKAVDVPGLPVVEGELNYIFTGCYTSQSRIKAANRYGEKHMDEAERLGALAAARGLIDYPADAFEAAWRNVLFNQFHDIIPGSGVVDTREHAMGLFQETLAIADTRRQKAMYALTSDLDTSAYIEEPYAQSTAEGAGVGFGVGQDVRESEQFRVAQVSRGSGKTRVFHAFNTADAPSGGPVEITVWDWPGDTGRMAFKDAGGAALNHQLLEKGEHHYWAHRYMRVLVDAPIPAFGRATLVLYERGDASPATPFPRDPRVETVPEYILENQHVRVRFDAQTGAITSFFDKAAGAERMCGFASPFTLIDEDADTEWGTTPGSSWVLGRYKKQEMLHCTVGDYRNGCLESSLSLVAKAEGVTIKARVYLRSDSPMLCYDLTVDWTRLNAPGVVPQLAFRIPAAVHNGQFSIEYGKVITGVTFINDIPAGTIMRAPLDNDVPAQSFAAMPYGDGRALMLVADSKYGFRQTNRDMQVTLLRTSNGPDQYPELGQHRMKIGVGVVDSSTNRSLLCAAQAFCRPPAAVSDKARAGTRPAAPESFVSAEGPIFLQAVKRAQDGKGLIIRGFETEGRGRGARVNLGVPVKGAWFADTHERKGGAPLATEGGAISFDARPYGVFTLYVDV